MNITREEDLQAGTRKAPTLARLGQYSSNLAIADRNLKDGVDFLDNKLSKRVFENDVKMYDNDYGEAIQSYISVNTFEATSSIIATTLQVVQMYRSNTTTGVLTDLNFVLRNIINDILIKTESVMNVFLMSLDADRIVNQHAMVILMIVTAVLLTVVMAVFVFLIRSFYLKEKQTITAFSQVSLKEISKVQERLDNFTSMIENEVSFEQLPSLKPRISFTERVSIVNQPVS